MDKNLGQVFTPPHIVDKIIKLTKYNEDCINKKILEPSFGEGVFLLQIIETLILKCLEENYSLKEIKKQIEENIYGIEIDKSLYNKTLCNIQELLKKYNLENVNLHLYNINTLDFDKEIKFDYILGNPPYVRIHNIDKETRKKIEKYNFSTGNTDLYIIFFELCINLLNTTGKLGFITPNSFLKNSSQKQFRNYLLENKLVEIVIDFKSNKIFENIDTYTAITILNKAIKKDNFKYIYNNGKNDIYSIDAKNKDFLNKEWYFLKNIGTTYLDSICKVQHGLATNADKIYISTISKKTKNTVMFNNFEIEKNILIPIIKGSRYEGNDINTYLIFPYIYKGEKYVIMEEEYLREKFPLTYKYLESNKTVLLNRNMEKNSKWYQFARSQAINTINKEKLVIKHIISENDIKVKFYKLDKNVAVYSGVYITSENDLNNIIEIIDTEQFCEFCKEVGKDMSGNYKRITAKNIKEYRF